MGGSIASTVHGEPRLTEDVDIEADILEQHVPALIARLAPSFHVPERRLRTAVRDGSSFSLIHLSAVRKVDIFVIGSQVLGSRELERRQSIVLTTERRFYARA